ncbi:MAG: polyisoprenoid-binding protein [Chitinophagaceae bacterium]|nr:MAG: polyisoprenoid-binding protein [Chitinophagaceae bacterium]
MENTTWTLDPTHSELQFKVKHLMITTVTGSLKELSADFFDASTYPAIIFTSTSFNKTGDNYALVGDLTIKDVTRSVKLDVEFAGIATDPWGNTKAGFTLAGKINRTDFGLTWNAALETGGVMVSEEVRILGELQFVKQA